VGIEPGNFRSSRPYSKEKSSDEKKDSNPSLKFHVFLL